MPDLNDEMKRWAEDAARDQMAAGFRSMAGLLGAYYAALLEAGVPAEVATALVVNLQHRLTTPQ